MLMIYLLKVDIPELLSPSGEEFLRVLKAIDPERVRTAKGMEKNPRGRAACIGAGLLLQYAVRNYGKIKNSSVGYPKGCITEVTIGDLLGPGEALDLKYRTGEQGKPYFTDDSLPFFNISHAGGMVVLAVSDTEVGIDIQDKRKNRETDMAERFFSERESRAVNEDESRDIFYRLWSRKEALGKCTGEGVRPYLDTDVYDLNAPHLSQYEWTEKVLHDGMHLCVCRCK